MIKKVYLWGITVLVCAVVGFYIIQNQYLSSGGPISFIKACWLGMTIFYWLFLPVLIFFDTRTIYKLRIAYIIFFISIFARVIVEIYLLYMKDAWTYEYGIAHDLFSLLLLFCLLIIISNKTNQSVLENTLKIITGMFIAETYFAYYMLQYMRAGNKDSIWFIPSTTEHLVNNSLTLIIVLTLVAWQIYFYRAWVRQ